MSTEASPTETSPSTPVTEPTKETSAPVSSDAATPKGKPAATRVVNIHTKRGPVSFEARGKVEQAAAASADSQSSQDKPSTPPKDSTSSPSEGSVSTTGAASEPAKEEPKPAPSRSLTIALEKEAKLVEERKAFKAERDAFEARAAQVDADLKAMQQARTLVKEGKRLKALELLGVTLDEVQDEFLAGLKEETPEDKAARIVRDTLAKERQAEADKVREREEAAAKERTAAEEARLGWWKDQAEKAYTARAGEFDPAAFEGVTADAIWQRAVKEFNATGKLPTHSEALDLVQKDFDARLAKSKRYRPAEAPATTEPAKDSPKAKDTPKTLTTRGAGSVPIVAKPQDRRKSAQERAKEAMRELGIVTD